MAERFIEVDSLRGVAIILMVAYHAVFDYNFFIERIFDVNSGIVLIVGRLSAVLFLLLVGISLTLTLHRKAFGTKYYVRHFTPRALKIIGLAVAITAITWIAFPQYTIWFGILHLIGAGIILSMPIVERKNLAGILGATIVGIGAYFYITQIQFASTIIELIPFTPARIQTFDYFPIFPWLGVIWIGIYLGHRLYPNGKSAFNFEKENILSYFGKHSLEIYLIHQPILVGLILVGKNFNLF